MQSPRIPYSTDLALAAQDAASKPRPSSFGRIALVATLAGFGLVALATQDIAPSYQSSAAPAGTTARFITDGSIDPEVQLALLANEDYFRGQSSKQSSSDERNVANAADVPATSPTTEDYLPARFELAANASDGNILTFEHD